MLNAAFLHCFKETGENAKAGREVISPTKLAHFLDSPILLRTAACFNMTIQLYLNITGEKQ